MTSRSVCYWMAGLLVVAAVGCQRERTGAARTFAPRSAGGEAVNVAVLPFEADVMEEAATATVTGQAIVCLLASGVVRVIEPGLVSDQLLQAQIQRPDQDLTRERLEQLRAGLPEADVFVVGRVNEYELVTGATQPYPSVSISARMIDARTGEIVWAETRSRTGGGGLFGMGRVSSLSIMSQMVVQSLAQSVRRHAPGILAHIAASRAQTGAEPATAPGPGPGPTAPTAPPAGPPAAAPTGALQDPQRPVGEQDLVALFIEVQGYTRNEVRYRRSFHPSATASYANGDVVLIKIVDYGNQQATARFLDHYAAGGPKEDFHGRPAIRTQAPEPGHTQRLIDAGRFGVFVTVPEDAEAAADAVARPIVEHLLG